MVVSASTKTIAHLALPLRGIACGRDLTMIPRDADVVLSHLQPSSSGIVRYNDFVRLLTHGRTHDRLQRPARAGLLVMRRNDK